MDILSEHAGSGWRTHLHIHSQLYYFPFSLSHQHSGKLAMLISLPELILHSWSVTARGHSLHKQQMSLNYWYYLNFCEMHAFQFSRPFSRALVREVCLHVKGLSALLPEHNIGTGVMLDLCGFFLLCCEAARVFHPSFFTPCYLCQ